MGGEPFEKAEALSTIARKKCLDYIEVLKKLIDVKIIDKKITQEYYENEEYIEDTNKNEIKY